MFEMSIYTFLGIVLILAGQTFILTLIMYCVFSRKPNKYGFVFPFIITLGMGMVMLMDVISLTGISDPVDVAMTLWAISCALSFVLGIWMTHARYDIDEKHRRSGADPYA